MNRFKLSQFLNTKILICILVLFAVLTLAFTLSCVAPVELAYASTPSSALDLTSQTSNKTYDGYGISWYYDANEDKGYASRTLELDGATIEFSGANEGASGLKLPANSTIVLVGGSTNAITGGKHSKTAYGIYCAGNLTIKGGGTLSVTGGIITSGSFTGIETTGTLTIENCTVNSTGATATTDNTSTSTGISAGNDTMGSDSITITQATVSAVGGNASSSSYGFYYPNNKYLKITNSNVTATGGDAWASYGIGGPGSGYLEMNGGSLTASAGKTTDKSYGIYVFIMRVKDGVVTATADTSTNNKSYGIYFSTAYEFSIAKGGLVASGCTQATNQAPTSLGDLATLKAGSDSKGTDTAYSKQLWLSVTFPKMVTFDANGGKFADDTGVNKATIIEGAVTMPANPTFGDYAFGGWYEDKSYTTAFTNSGLSSDVTVYPKWMVGEKAVRFKALDVTDVTTLSDGAGVAITLNDGAYTCVKEGWSWTPNSGYVSTDPVSATNNVGTLALDGLHLQATSLDGEIALRLPAGAIVQLAPSSDNAIYTYTSGQYYYYGIKADGDLLVTGGGSLSATAGHGDESWGIYVKGTLTVNAGANLKGEYTSAYGRTSTIQGSSDARSSGVYIEKDTVVDNASLEGVGGYKTTTADASQGFGSGGITVLGSLSATNSTLTGTTVNDHIAKGSAGGISAVKGITLTTSRLIAFAKCGSSGSATAIGVGDTSCSITAVNAIATNANADFVSGSTRDLYSKDKTKSVILANDIPSYGNSFGKNDYEFDSFDKGELDTLTGYKFLGWYNGATELTTVDDAQDGVLYKAKWSNNNKVVRTEPLDLSSGVASQNTNEGWSFATEGSKNVLTLYGVTFNCSGISDTAFAIKLPANSTILLADGTTSIVVAGKESYLASHAIDCDGALTVLGNGTLNATAFNISNYVAATSMVGINAAGAVTIGSTTDSPVVTADSANYGKGYGIYGTSVTIVNGNVTAIGGTGAFGYDGDNFTATNANFKCGYNSSNTYTTYAKYYTWVNVRFANVVTFNANNGAFANGTSSATSEADKTTQKAPLPTTNPTRAGYSFDSWNTKADGTGTSFTASTAVTENVTVYAKWTAKTNTTYKVEHYQQNIDDDNYTIVTADTENKAGTTATKTAAVAKTYEGFATVATGEKAFAQVDIAGDGSTIVKVYYDRKKYTVKYVDGTTTKQTIANVKYGATTPTYTNSTPTKTGDNYADSYSFKDWGTVATTVTADATYSAVYNATYKTYALTLELNGGTLTSAPSTYTARAEYTLPTPTKSGHAFAGWFENANHTGVAIAKIPSDAYGAKTYYAEWLLTSFENTDNGVKIENEDGVAPSGVLNVNKLEPTDDQKEIIKNAFGDDFDLVTILDIVLKDGDATIPPSGEVKLTIRVPDELKSAEIIRVVTFGEGGTLRKYECAVEDNYISFVTDELTQCALVVEKTDGGVNGGGLSGGAIAGIVIGLLLFLLLLLIGLYVAWKYEKLIKGDTADKIFVPIDKVAIKVCRVFYKKDALFTVAGTVDDQKENQQADDMTENENESEK